MSRRFAAHVFLVWLRLGHTKGPGKQLEQAGTCDLKCSKGAASRGIYVNKVCMCSLRFALDMSDALVLQRNL
eukprot:3536516-Amphidinium_carterae.1